MPFERRQGLQSEVYAVSQALRGFLDEKNKKGWQISFETLPDPSLPIKK
jgi:hypothetical protein